MTATEPEMLEVRLEPYTGEDREELRDFLKSAWREVHEGELGVDLTDRLVARLDSDDLAGVVPEDGKVLLARHKTSIVGSLVAARRGEVIYLWAFYQAKAFRGRGLGRLMLQDMTKHYDPSEVVAVHVLKGNDRAQKFYEKLGFQECWEEPFEVVIGEYRPALVLQARVASLDLNRDVK